MPMKMSQQEAQNVYRRPKTCNTGKRKIYYFTTGRQISEEALKEMKNEILRPYEKALQLKSMNDVQRFREEESSRKVRERQANYANHHTHRSRVNLLWKSERLFVSDNITLPGTSITDNIDPNFFKIVSGRPIREKKSTREYLQDLRDCFLTRLKMGYHFDEMLLMDELHFNERQKLCQTKRGFLSTLKSFEAFLKEDHAVSSSLLDFAKESERKSKHKLELINNLKEELKNLQADVSIVQDEWRNLRMFQKFLYQISPTEWRKVHDPYFGREDGEFSDDSYSELDSKILRFQEEIKDGQPPALYFTDPQEIVSIFAELEKNDLQALTHCMRLDIPAESLLTELERKKVWFEREQKSLQEEIKFLQNMVEAEEKNFTENESKTKEMVFGLFRDLITNEDYLSVTSYVEDAYEDAIAPSDGSLDLVTMIKDIELKHESLLLALDMSPNFIVTRITSQFYRAQKRELKEAKEADRKVRQMELLLNRLSKSLSFPKKNAKERKIVPRSLPPEELMFKFKLPIIPSKEKRDQIFFFGKEPNKVRLLRPLCL